MKQPKSSEAKYWDNARFRHLLYIEDLENYVAQLIPTEEEINEQIDRYAFRVPYDGSDTFYDLVALKHYKAGIDYILSLIKERNENTIIPQI